MYFKKLNSQQNTAPSNIFVKYKLMCFHGPNPLKKVKIKCDSLWFRHKAMKWVMIISVLDTRHMFAQN